VYDFQQIISILKNSFEHVLRLFSEKLNQKFLQLKREHEKQKISANKPKHFPAPGVINLSKREITKKEKDILRYKFRIKSRESIGKRNNLK